jgi:acyl-ACP thioesterase
VFDNLLRYIQFKAFGRGLRGYHTAWIVVGVAVWMINRARHQDDVVFRTVLKPGERLIVKATRPSSGSSSDS